MNRTSSELRRAFLDFFVANGHREVASAPIVPPNDPSLMFTNAGMVQFKDTFTGRERREYSRAVSSQKCIRISGKHNDLESVGPSPRHHTFFEMLGNFSFGDYFKEEAIVFAWEFLTRELELPKDRLICTYFKGEDGVEADEQAKSIWGKVTGFGPDRVRGLGMEDNFWRMGDTGPCGPCSEIYYYHGPEVDLSNFGEEQTPEGAGWMEIWNLVFMQFERSVVDGMSELSPLPAPSIDTGAGLERLACVLQGKTNNYDVDLLRALVDEAAEASGKPYGGTMAPDDVSMRVIADHARTTAFMMAEGILPDRTGRSYVLRRVMRRAIRHGHRLGIKEPFLNRVATKVVDLMGDQYPELRERRELIATMSEGEEQRFRQTIERGLSLLEERFSDLEQQGSQTLAGGDAFKLYDTYGFPLDLTRVICEERGVVVDEEGYQTSLEAAQELSSFKAMDQAVEQVYRVALERVPKGEVQFTGYERTEDQGRVVAILSGGEVVERAEVGDEVEIIADRTPFYAESGGQVADTGRLTGPSGEYSVEDTQRPIAHLTVHRGRVTAGALSVGEKLELRVDVERRDAIRRNHSATHLLHHALRETVGEHAQQKGSLVDAERLRFDFTHTEGLGSEQLREIEDRVNAAILANYPVRTEVVSMEEARSRGVTMIFEEKYGDVVRVLSMGPSRELCGGTHARATGDIGVFKISTEQGVAAGVRRIFATTGRGSLERWRETEGVLQEACARLRTSPALLDDKLEKLVAREKALTKQVEELQRKLASGAGTGGRDPIHDARSIAGVSVLGVQTDVTDRAALREMAEQLRDKLGDSVVLVGSESAGKAQLVLTVSKTLTSRFRAGDLIRPIAQIVGGSGGGRPDMAQAGGTEPQHLAKAIQAVYAQVEASGGQP